MNSFGYGVTDSSLVWQKIFNQFLHDSWVSSSAAYVCFSLQSCCRSARCSQIPTRTTRSSRRSLGCTRRTRIATTSWQRTGHRNTPCNVLSPGIYPEHRTSSSPLWSINKQKHRVGKRTAETKTTFYVFRCNVWRKYVRRNT